MVKEDRTIRRNRRPPRPLDAARLEELALAYVARFATSAAKLEAYLARKLRERGWDGEDPADVPAMVARFVERGYIDDESYARMRTGGLLRRGYGPRRIGQALGMAGVGADIQEIVSPDEREARRAALTMARKRRFGPFGVLPLERAKREKQVAAMLRAGHELGSALALIDAASIEQAECWADESEGI